MKLSLLIPSTSDREPFYAELMTELCRQVRVLSEWYERDYWQDVEILKDTSPVGVSIGTKRNWLLQNCTGEWCAFIDSDDMVSRDYIRTILPLLAANPDCLSLRGIMTTNGDNPEVFEHSIRYLEWRETHNTIKYERSPNHLNTIRTSIARQFKFPETNFAEDHAWSTALHASGLLVRETYVDQVLYYYKYRSVK